MVLRSPGTNKRLLRTETQFVRWLQTRMPRGTRGLKLGIGDDAAVVRPSAGCDLVLKSDMSIEDVHFSLALHPAASVGHRALARPLSDIAAMGGIPKFVLVSLALSDRTKTSWIKGFYNGLSATARRFGVSLVGGDTARARGHVYIDVIAIGEVLHGRAVARSGARPGDQIYVSGRLGVSALGLHLLKSRLSDSARSSHGGRLSHREKKSPASLETGGTGIELQSSGAARAVQHHLYPEPRCALGRFLADHRLASAMIDISDGLSTDLNHLCTSSGTGAYVWANLIPGPEMRTAAGRGPTQPIPQADPSTGNTNTAIFPADSLELALHGGEDYELLFTVRKRKLSQVPGDFEGLPLHRIGEIHRSKDVRLVYPDGRRLTLHPGGYDHFRRDHGSQDKGEAGSKRLTNVQNH